MSGEGGALQALTHGFVRCETFEREGGETQVMGCLGAKGRDRTADTSIFSAVLYQLSYLGAGRNGTGVW